MSSEKQHLGDGLFYSFDGWHIELSAERGDGNIHRVYLEPAVYEALVRWHKHVIDEVTRDGKT